MENKYFREAGDLDDVSVSMGVEAESKHFKPMGDLNDDGKNLIYPKKENEDFTPFRTPEEIVDYFRPMGDLNDESKNVIHPKNPDENKNAVLPKGNTEDFTPFKSPEEIVDYFRPAGDLDDELTTGGLGTESKHFKPMGDLSMDGKNLVYPRTEAPDLIPFRKPENLNEINNEITKKTSNNEEIINKLNNNINKINDYLLTVVSGKKYDSVCELGVLMGAGIMIVGLKQLMQMVDEGYNIVSARVINADADMIEVEFQEYKYDEELMEKRRRF